MRPICEGTRTRMSGPRQWWQERQRTLYREKEEGLPPGDAPWWAYLLIASSALNYLAPRPEFVDGWFGTYLFLSINIAASGGIVFGLWFARKAWKVRPSRPARQRARRGGHRRPPVQG